jgi:hypothetical protein
MQGQSESFKNVAVDIVLEQLCSLKEDGAVLDKLKSMSSLDGRNLTGVLSYCFRAKSQPEWLDFLKERFDDLSSDQKYTVMVNLIRIKEDPEINEFLLEHIMVLDDKK